ncbi:MAG: hypothetical protein KKC19_00665 [Nanoarchaeota archaeon]|nr:hypothetical protein [Nanoarchaeota archaeon]
MDEEIRCDICDKNFGNAEALEMHNSVKHSEIEKKEDRSKRRGVKGYGFMILVFVLLVWGGSALLKKQENYDDFNLCLKESGAKIYGTYWCSACAQQKRVLGESKNIPYVECSLPNRAGQTAECIALDIQSYPTWEFNDSSRLVGILSLENLSAKTGCVVESD